MRVGCCIDRRCPVSLQGPNEIARSKPAVATNAEPFQSPGFASLVVLFCGVHSIISAVGFPNNSKTHAANSSGTN